MRAVVGFLLLVTTLVYPRLGEAQTQGHTELSEIDARNLLLLVVKYEGYDLKKPGMGLDLVTTRSHQPVYPGYFEFSLTYDSPSAGATAALRLYAVSQWTGDVWEVNLCKRYTFPDLENAQRSIQAKTGYTFLDEKDIRRGLGCGDD